jgi:hypothetical protein
MQEEVARFLASLRETADFESVDMSDVNACASDGDNALHVAVRKAGVAIARALMDAGIEINKAGDLGYTPLHVACMYGNLDMVERGADVFALSEGYPPFTVARMAKQDHICDFLAPVMERLQAGDPNVRVRTRIAQLRRELDDLEAKLRA